MEIQFSSKLILISNVKSNPKSFFPSKLVQNIDSYSARYKRGESVFGEAEQTQCLKINFN